jgi:hypothetical protein
VALWREAALLALYVSIVLLAELLALPNDYGDTAHQGPSLLGIVWGTAIGLALAHWFAFQVAAEWFRGGKAVREDFQRAVAQLAGAGLVAVATTIPILLFDSAVEVEAAAFVPALVIAASGFGMGRAAGHSVRWSIVVGVLVLAVGVGVAVIKALLSH